MRDRRRVGTRGTGSSRCIRDMASATLQTALVLGDAALVEARLARRSGARDRDRADRRTGSRCSTCATRACISRRCLLAWTDSSRLRGGSAPSARIQTRSTTGTGTRSCRGRRFGASICAIRHLPLAEVVLEAGANPTDGVTAHIAGGGGSVAVLDLLHRHGVNVNGIPGGVPPLVLHVGWADDPAGRRPRLIAHGADANLAWGRRINADPRGGETMGCGRCRSLVAPWRRRVATTR